MDEILKSIPVCSLCCQLINNVEVGAELTPGGLTLSDGTEGFCGVCLGLLQEDSVRDLKASMVRQLEGYELCAGQGYNLSFVVPVGTVFRSYMLKAYYNKAGVRSSGVVDLKDVLRRILDPVIVEHMKGDGHGLPCVNILLECDHPEADGHEQMECLADENPRKRNKWHAKRQKKEHHQKTLSSSKLTSTFGDTGGYEEVGRILGHEDFEKCLQKVSTKANVELSVTRDIIFLTGDYCKYSRTLSQSPWVLEGVRKTKESVEELVCTKIAAAYGTDSYKFHTAGREDVDVRMLGKGRGFVIEVLDAKHKLKKPIEDIQADVNSGPQVEIKNLKVDTKECMLRLHYAATQHKKIYAATIQVKGKVTKDDIAKINDLKDLKVEQRTPLRVLHRRPNSIRPKTIHWMSAELHNEHFLTLRLETDAGTYIKEFVHGDLGRTNPSISSLIGDADILQLDVQDLVE